MKIIDVIKKYRKIPLSGHNLLQLVDGKANIVLYPNMHYYKNIDQLLDPFDACFILFESKPNYGHWCLLFKINPHTIEFFNPYQGFPDDSLKFINKQFKSITNQDFPYLSHLLYNSPYDLTYNEYPFQKFANDISTCGRWCAIRLIYKYFDLRLFAYLFFNKFGDDLVTLLTMHINQ